MSVDLILVHSGNIFPFHINSTIKLAKKYLFKIHIIIDQQFIDHIEDKSCIIVSSNSLEDSRYQTYNIKNYNLQFRDNFFSRTSSRFILLDNYISKNNIESCFHIENDIAMFSDLLKAQNVLENSEYDTAIVLDNATRCVPSIIWYRNKFSSNRMSSFIYKNNNIDDMRNLAIYFFENRGKVTNLPIVPFDLIDHHNDINYGNMYKDFNSIFDGAAIGQYLYGIDSLNGNTNTKGFINETCVFNASGYVYLENSKPVFNYLNQKTIINNLHIHSKNFTELL